MSVKFILGRGGSGKSTYMLDKIQERVQDNETSPVILLVPEQYTFEMEKKMSRLFTGDKKDKYLRARVLSFKTMSDIVFSNVGGLTDVNINSSGKAMITYRAIESVSNDLEIFSKSASQPGFVNSISEIISEMKQYNISYEKLETIAQEVDNETLKLKLKDLSKIYKQFEMDNTKRKYNNQITRHILYENKISLESENDVDKVIIRAVVNNYKKDSPEEYRAVVEDISNRFRARLVEKDNKLYLETFLIKKED